MLWCFWNGHYGKNTVFIESGKKTFGVVTELISFIVGIKQQCYASFNMLLCNIRITIFFICILILHPDQIEIINQIVWQTNNSVEIIDAVFVLNADNAGVPILPITSGMSVIAFIEIGYYLHRRYGKFSAFFRSMETESKIRAEADNGHEVRCGIEIRINILCVQQFNHPVYFIRCFWFFPQAFILHFLPLRRGGLFSMKLRYDGQHYAAPKR